MADGLERYQIMETLGVGGNATTFRGVDRQTGESVAIKVLSLKGLGDWSLFDRFEREAAVLASLEHPGIVRYRDRYASESTGDFFLVMDLVEGEPLSQSLAQGRKMGEREARDLLLKLLEVLEYLHGQTPPLVHRDVKPSNLIRRPGGEVVLVDFGGARTVSDGTLTTTGTLGYMAPEQLHGTATPQSDLYGLASTVVALMSGKPPEALEHDGLRLDVTPVVPAGPLRDALAAMLEPEPRARVPDVASVRAMLRPALGEAAGGSTPQRVTPGTVAIPEALEDLVRVPKPFSALVWSGALAFWIAFSLTDSVVMPFVRRLVRRHSRDEGVHEDLDEAGKVIRRGSQIAREVAKRTDPFRSD